MSTMPTMRVASESQCFHTWVTALLGNILRFHNVKNAFNNASLSKLVDKLFIFHVKKALVLLLILMDIMFCLFLCCKSHIALKGRNLPKEFKNYSVFHQTFDMILIFYQNTTGKR